eukprot:5802123-Amphidinium_carterae.1
MPSYEVRIDLDEAISCTEIVNSYELQEHSTAQLGYKSLQGGQTTQTSVWRVFVLGTPLTSRRFR